VTKTVNLGPEHDVALQHAVLWVLREMGADIGQASWAVAGSQEIINRRVTVRGIDVCLEAETYIGLTIKGDGAMVDEIAKRTHEQWRQSERPQSRRVRNGRS